jgi:hypothetical protein
MNRLKLAVPHTFMGFVVTIALIMSVMFFVGCDERIKTGDSTITEMEQTEVNQQRLVKAVPPPVLTDSLERHNLSERLKRLNKSDAIGYVYLLSLDGKIVAYYTVKGKVSSLNSLLTTPVQTVRIGFGTDGSSYHDLPSPDFDGSYGKNPEGIFFFTTDGAYVEWTGNHLYSDRPLRISQPPVMVMDVKDETPVVTPAKPLPLPTSAKPHS